MRAPFRVVLPNPGRVVDAGVWRCHGLGVALALDAVSPAGGCTMTEQQKAGSSLPELLPRHLEVLVTKSGIDPAVVEERGSYSAVGSDQLRVIGFSDRQSKNVPCIVMPVWAPDGSNGLCALRPDHPPVDADGRRQKYILPWKSSPRLDVPPRCRPMLPDPSIDLWITEGQKKGDALASRGLCAVALLGVWMFKGKNDFGAPTLLADFDLIAWKGRRVYLVFDSDVMFK
jgi:hypothetical protein